MTDVVVIERAGPGLTVQDLGRPGQIANGLSRGGAMDRLALLEAAALLELADPVAAIEMAGAGGVFSTNAPTRFALTGAPMKASIDGSPIAWNATHVLSPGRRLTIGGAQQGVYGYLTFAGGVKIPPLLNSRSTHLTAAIGRRLAQGDALPIGADRDLSPVSLGLTPQARFSGGTVRLMPGPQTDLFSGATRERFAATCFLRSAHANRQGIRLDRAGAPFSIEQAADLASDFILPGDVQMTGEGVPFVLMTECQTIGGYPRIGTVLPADLPLVAQAQVSAELRFHLISLDEADAAYRSEADQLRALREAVAPLIRDPHDVRDLLSYQLISGVICGDDDERT